jgi:hypothetical protein
VRCVALDRAGKVLAVGCDDGRLHCYDVRHADGSSLKARTTSKLCVFAFA